MFFKYHSIHPDVQCISTQVDERDYGRRGDVLYIKGMGYSDYGRKGDVLYIQGGVIVIMDGGVMYCT